MADPEIARRCRWCGASIRVRGLFCPQCGKPTSAPAPDASSPEPAIETEEVFLAPDTVSVDLPSLPTSDLADDAFRAAETVPLQPLVSDVENVGMRPPELATTRFPVNKNYSPARGSREEKVRQRSGRETPGGDVKKGFGKVREISNVMLEEASYDPSARFVLVAAVLFVLFLVILLLSEMMR
ncbi:MAG: zinc ribbon domain-containing protein [Pyrinomonadaceae bacterium]